MTAIQNYGTVGPLGPHHLSNLPTKLDQIWWWNLDLGMVMGDSSENTDGAVQFSDWKTGIFSSFQVQNRVFVVSFLFFLGGREGVYIKIGAHHGWHFCWSFKPWCVTMAFLLSRQVVQWPCRPRYCDVAERRPLRRGHAISRWEREVKSDEWNFWYLTAIPMYQCLF